MGFEYTKIGEEIYLRIDPSSKAAQIDIVRISDSSNVYRSETLLRMDRREAAAVAYLLEAGQGSIMWRGGMMAIFPRGATVARRGSEEWIFNGSRESDGLLSVSLNGRNEEPIPVDTQLVSRRIYQLLEL